jgi:hypothetical protein
MFNTRTKSIVFNGVVGTLCILFIVCWLYYKNTIKRSYILNKEQSDLIAKSYISTMVNKYRTQQANETNQQISKDLPIWENDYDMVYNSRLY